MPTQGSHYEAARNIAGTIKFRKQQRKSLEVKQFFLFFCVPQMISLKNVFVKCMQLGIKPNVFGFNT